MISAISEIRESRCSYVVLLSTVPSFGLAADVKTFLLYPQETLLTLLLSLLPSLMPTVMPQCSIGFFIVTA